MRIASFSRELLGIVGPLAVTVVIVALALRVLNSAPAYVTALMSGPPPAPNVLDERLSYPSIEAAEKDLGVKVYSPAYFPSYLLWPPASIRGQREPAKVVSLLVRSTDGQQALQIREVFWQGAELPFPIPEPAQVIERRDVDLDGVQARLLLGKSEGGGEVNQLRWRAGGVQFVVTSIYSPEELLRIAGSME